MTIVSRSIHVPGDYLHMTYGIVEPDDLYEELFYLLDNEPEQDEQ
jgi:hypothetical protein